MKIGRIAIAAVSLCVTGGLAEAGLPKPVSLLKRTTTSQSTGTPGLPSTRYNKASFGNRWRQSLGPITPTVSPYVRGR